MKRKLAFWRGLRTSESQAQRLIGRLYSEAILGNRVVVGAIETAEKAIAASDSVEAAGESLARWDIGAAVARGAVAGVGGFSTLLVAVPASVASSWLLCMRLAFAIAHLGGHDVWEPATCNRAFACVTGDAQPAGVVDAGVVDAAGASAAVDAEAARVARALQLQAASGDSSSHGGLDLAAAPLGQQPEPEQEQEDDDADSPTLTVTPITETGVAVAAVQVGEAVVIAAAERAAEAAAMQAAKQAATTVFQTQLATQLELAAAKGLSGASAQSFATAAAERSAGKALEAVYQVQLAEQAGARLATAAGARSWASMLPLVGAAITGAIEGVSAAAVARRAKASFILECLPVLEAKQCSWCQAVSDHHREFSRAVGRDLYKCDGCAGTTAVCVVYGCARMAKGGKWRTDRWCQWCQGSDTGRAATKLFAQTADIYGKRKPAEPGSPEGPVGGAMPMWTVRGGELIVE